MRCEGGSVWRERRALYAWVMGTQARSLREIKVHSTCGQNALMQINTCDWSIRAENFLYFQVTLSKSPVYNSWWHSKYKSVTAGSRNSMANHLFTRTYPTLRSTYFKQWPNSRNSSLGESVYKSVQKWFRDDESLSLAVPEVHCCTLYPTHLVHSASMAKDKTSF